MTLDTAKADPAEMMKLMFNKELVLQVFKQPKFLAFVDELLPVLLEEGVLDEIIQSN